MYTCLFDEPERVADEVARYLAADAGLVQTAAADRLVADNRVVLTYLPMEDGSDG
jgi:hypothetical protein